MAEFEYYPIGVYGNIAIKEDAQLLQSILNSDYGMPLVQTGDVIGEERLTPQGDELLQIVSGVNVKLQVLTNGTGGWVSNTDLKNILQQGLRKIFSTCELSFKSAGKVPRPIQPVQEVPMWVSSEEQTFEVIGGPQVYNFDIFYSDFKNPPTDDYLGQLSINVDTLEGVFSIQCGFILTDNANKKQWWINIIYQQSYDDNTKIFKTNRFFCSPEQLEYQLVSQIIANIQPIDPEDPFGNDPNEEDSGGNGDNDDSSDDVEEPGIPGLDATDTSFVSIYNPSTQELRQIFDYVWSSSWFGAEGEPLENIAKSFKFSLVNPLSALLGLLLIPVKPQTGQSRNVKLGQLDTGVSVLQVTNQFVRFSCGSIYIPNFYNTFLDYSPHTKYTLYMPFIGSQTLEADQITGKTLQLSYTFDVMTGGCVAFVKADGSVIGQFQGACAVQLPLSSSNYSEVANTLITMPAKVANAIGAVRSAGGMAGFGIQTEVASGVMNVLKQDINVSGTIKGDAGYMAVRQPYLTITRPNMVYTPPGTRQKLMGYPSGRYVQLSELSGFTKVLEVNVNQMGIPSESSVNEITQLLKEGVVL